MTVRGGLLLLLLFSVACLMANFSVACLQFFNECTFNFRGIFRKNSSAQILENKFSGADINISLGTSCWARDQSACITG